MRVEVPVVVSLELVVCYTCGVTFGLPAEFDQNRRGDKKLWHCPNGHEQYYTGKPVSKQLSEAEDSARLLREELSVAYATSARRAKELTALRRRVRGKK